MDIFKLQKRIVPELMEILERRYCILRSIKYNEPIGRRVLASSLSLGERTVRNEIEFLNSSELIKVCNEGMYITEEGREIIESLQNFIHELKGLKETEEKIKEYLSIKKVYVVPGSYEDDANIVQEVGRTSALYLKEILKDDMIISLTGGNTIKEVVDNMPKISKLKNILVLPARGGMGRNVGTQANTLTAILAEKVSGSYKLLHVPDNLSENALKAILEEPSISEIIKNLKKSNIVIYGVGRADEMAEKRGLTKELRDEILKKGAVGEALGNYYDIQGNIVYKHTTIGINEEDANEMEYSIAVAADYKKAEAIIGALKGKENSVLIIDEGTAERILHIINN